MGGMLHGGQRVAVGGCSALALNSRLLFVVSDGTGSAH